MIFFGFRDTLKPLKKELKLAGADMMAVKNWQKEYEKVKKKIMELPIAEAEKQMKLVDEFFQCMLDGKTFTVHIPSANEKKVDKQVKTKTAQEDVKKQTVKEQIKKEQVPPQRPRLKLTGFCPSCKKKTYLQFTDGYFCPSCNVLRMEGTVDSKKKELQERMNKVLFDYKTSPEKRIHEIKAMLVYDSNSAQLYSRLGFAYRQMGDNESAMKYYRKALELDDRDGVIYSNMGVVFTLQGNYHQAKDALETAYACWEVGDYTDWIPQVTFANYAIVLQKTGNSQKAFKILKKAHDYGYDNTEVVFKVWAVGKELCANKIEQLIQKPQYPYSSALKNDNATFQKVKKHFSIQDDNSLYYFLDYTVFGGCKEGIAVCADGIYFKMLSQKLKVIKWYELGQYEFSSINDKNINVKKKEKDGSFSLVTMYFLQKQDGMNFLNALWQMQKL